MPETKKELTLSQKHDIGNACHSFVSILVETGTITHPSVFEEVVNTAAMFGYTLICEQRGIRGTTVRFEKT